MRCNNLENHYYVWCGLVRSGEVAGLGYRPMSASVSTEYLFPEESLLMYQWYITVA